MEETEAVGKLNKVSRRWAILEYLRSSEGSGHMAALSRAFGVSEMTIRRDLHTLVHQGLISVAGKDVHVVPSTTITEEIYHLKLAGSQSLKTAIAAAAVQHIHENMTVFLDGGTTIGALAPLLFPMKRITVITNALNVLNVLSSSSGIRLIGIGGTLRPESQTFLGAKANAMMAQLRIDLSFIGTESFSVSTGLEVPDEADAAFKEAVLRSSKASVLMVTSNKLNQTRLYQFAQWHAIARIITDQGLPDDVEQALRALGVMVTRVAG